MSPNPPAELAADRKAGPNKEKENGDGAAQKTDAWTHAVAGGEAKAGDAPATATTKPGEKAPISGMLNGKAIILPQPEYPAIAAQAKRCRYRDSPGAPSTKREM